MSGHAGEPLEEQSPEQIFVLAEVKHRLDGFCAELEQMGLRVHRDGLSVRIDPPAPPVPPDAPDLWLGSDL